MIYLDTNVLVWLYGGVYERLSETAKVLLESEQQFCIAPMVELELEYLHEIGRIKAVATEIVLSLQSVFPLAVCQNAMPDVIRMAKQLKWTRDPFDRIIVAQAALSNDDLLTADQRILKCYPHAIW